MHSSVARRVPVCSSSMRRSLLESPGGADFGLRGLFLAALRGRIGFERPQQARADTFNFVDCSHKWTFIRQGWTVKPGDLADELQRGRVDLLGRHRRIEIE